MPDISIKVDGYHFKNPFVIGSGPRSRPVSACEDDPLAGFVPTTSPQP